ncbi:MAG: hypothetical protein ABI442_10710 [Gemmatimonadaceae bacterium]
MTAYARMLVFAATVVASGAVRSAAQGVPSTDVYLAPISLDNYGALVIGTPVNITNRPGYDNQPSFTPDNRAILYTSTRDDGQSDIYRYDIATKKITRVTKTAESEYSAQAMPDGKRFSVIRVERDSTQRLWSFAMNGSDPRLVIKNLKPVGYHAWIDAENLATFVLGSPNALVHTNLKTGKSDTLARNIGRSLSPERLPAKSAAPKDRAFTFTHRVDSVSMLAMIRLPDRKPEELVAMPRGAQDYAWVSDSLVVTSLDTKLLSWHRGAKGWTEAADFVAAGLTKVSRLAVSRDGKWLAIVAEPRP